MNLKLEDLDWDKIRLDLDVNGYALISSVLSDRECDDVAALYSSENGENIFRSRVVMAKHGFGKGEYQYFSYPLPPLVHELRSGIYPYLVPTANQWNERMKVSVRYPYAHDEFVQRCHEAGQNRPTPLLLRYQTGDYNCLHQDMYGEHVFSLQVVILLSTPEKDFMGGEFVLTEHLPKNQTRPQVVTLKKGDAVVFGVMTRPQAGVRGFHKVNMRHGVSKLISGSRHTLGVIFHDAT